MSAAAPVPSHSVQEEPQTDSEKSQRSQAVNQEETARLAYALWQSRGCPEGSPDEDWFAAEEKLRASYELRAGESPADHQVTEKIGPSVERRLLNPVREVERIA